MSLYLLVQRFSHLSLASARRPEGLEFSQFRFNHTRSVLTTQRIDDFLLHGLWSRHAALPPSFRNSSQLAGISRVCTGSSNNPDTFRYTHFPPLMRRTISLRNPWQSQVRCQLLIHVRRDAPATASCSFHRSAFTPTTRSQSSSGNSARPAATAMRGNSCCASGGKR